MSVLVWFILGILLAPFVPGCEFVAVALIWSSLGFAGMCWFTDRPADIPAALAVAGIGFFTLFLRGKVAARLW